jgi:hypothetical protein
MESARGPVGHGDVPIPPTAVVPDEFRVLSMDTLVESAPAGPASGGLLEPPSRSKPSPASVELPPVQAPEPARPPPASPLAPVAPPSSAADLPQKKRHLQPSTKPLGSSPAGSRTQATPPGDAAADLDAQGSKRARRPPKRFNEDIHDTKEAMLIDQAIHNSRIETHLEVDAQIPEAPTYRFVAL